MAEPLHQVNDLSELSEQDQRVFDALVEAGFELDAIRPADRPRAEKLMQVMGLLDALPAPSPGDLLAERTIVAVAEARRAEKATGTEGGGFAPSTRLGDVLAVAAVLLIGVSVVMPSLNLGREKARQVASQSNLAGAFAGLTRYADAHAGELPRTRFKQGDQWWLTNQFDDEGNARSNSAHAFVLIRSGHVDPKMLISPANRNAPQRVTVTMRDWANDRQISYSFRNVFTPGAATISQPATALMADKNPLIMAGQFRKDIEPTSVSSNHAKAGGQNVLMGNGAVQWHTSPVINGDNIWTPGDAAEVLKGIELPDSATDAFLVQ